MQVSNPNNIKIYNLSAGKSLPEWLSERKRRTLLKKNVDIRRRIELIQDFDMPGVSTSIKVSKDGHYILATGIYKPRVKCFDVNNLSLKFERCFDSEVVTFQILSDDYSKLVFLHCDRHIEIHAAHGKYFRLRIPRFGRDMEYHYPSCDLFVVGVSNEIYRLNMERGQFLQPYISESSAINKCSINPVHHLLAVGTQEGKVEAWDPRVRNKVATLDCGFHCVTQDSRLSSVPSITALKFHGALTMGVGTVTGQVLLYDIRSSKPFIVKDHMYGLPIRNVEFHDKMDLVYSMDSSIVKIWEKQTGKLYTSIEAEHDLNDLCVIPNTGMLFMANENPKMQTYYIPSLGPAPSWSGFLDNLTEELEELDHETIYDDYKFVTEKELEELDLTHLKGTNLLRAYMHGYFMDIRLYRKARDAIKPFAFEDYKKKKIREKIDEDAANRVQIEKLPQVNKELALKLMDIDSESTAKNKKKKTAAIMANNILKDDRFKALFSNPDFQVNKDSEEYSLLNPVISQLDKSRSKKLREIVVQDEKRTRTAVEEEENAETHDDGGSSLDESSDDEKPWVKEVKKNYRLVKRNEKRKEMEEEAAAAEEVSDDEESPQKRRNNQPKFFEIKEGVEFKNGRTYMKKRNKTSLGERLQTEESHNVRVTGSRGNREMTFTTGKRKATGKSRDQVKRHRKENKGLLRPAGNIGKKKY
ncbi:nucleolar protein 10 [Venturia canescens]|uniref:nucleolar protein 10 n=1 Tax=Venturia canescens TaxID=32260 RepID=UPI001C9CF43F|nr:nucleolar protein 10 [Venturia canescens]